MHPTTIYAVAAGRNKELRDQAAAIRLGRPGRRSRTSQGWFRAHGRPWLRSAEPVMNTCPAASAR
jgi:hypothetical protein